MGTTVRPKVVESAEGQPELVGDGATNKPRVEPSQSGSTVGPIKDLLLAQLGGQYPQMMRYSEPLILGGLGCFALWVAYKQVREIGKET